MTISVKIEDGCGGTSKQVKVSEHGELLTRAFDYSRSVSVTLDSGNTAFNLYLPKTDTFFIITGIILSTNSKINNVDGTIVTIYQSDGEDSLTETGQPLTLNMLRSSNIEILPISVKTQKGSFINVRHDDVTVNAEVFCTMLGYYIPADGFQFSVIP